MKKLLLLGLIGFVFSTCGNSAKEYLPIHQEYAEAMCQCEQPLVKYMNDNKEPGQLLLDLREKKDKSKEMGVPFDFKPTQRQSDMMGKFIGNMGPLFDMIGECEYNLQSKYAGKKGMQEVMQLEGKANIDFMKKYCPALNDPFFNKMMDIVDRMPK